MTTTTYYAIARLDDGRYLLKTGDWAHFNSSAFDVPAFRLFTSMTSANIYIEESSVGRISVQVVPVSGGAK